MSDPNTVSLLPLLRYLKIQLHALEAYLTALCAMNSFASSNSWSNYLQQMVITNRQTAATTNHNLLVILANKTQPSPMYHNATLQSEFCLLHALQTVKLLRFEAWRMIFVSLPGCSDFVQYDWTPNKQTTQTNNTNIQGPFGFHDSLAGAFHQFLCCQGRLNTSTSTTTNSEKRFLRDTHLNNVHQFGENLTLMLIVVLWP